MFAYNIHCNVLTMRVNLLIIINYTLPKGDLSSVYKGRICWNRTFILEIMTKIIHTVINETTITDNKVLLISCNDQQFNTELNSQRSNTLPLSVCTI